MPAPNVTIAQNLGAVFVMLSAMQCVVESWTHPVPKVCTQLQDFHNAHFNIQCHATQKQNINFIHLAIDRSAAIGDDLLAASGHGGDECLEEFSVELPPTLLDPSFETRSQLTGNREVGHSTHIFPTFFFRG